MAESPKDIRSRSARGTRGPAPEHTHQAIAHAAIALADVEGLRGVTMRRTAAEIGAGAASLYRYFATREELLDLMIDEAFSELPDARPNLGSYLAGMLDLAQETRTVCLRHPWLLDALATRDPLGPHILDYLERALAILDAVDAPARTKLEAIAIFSGVVRLLVRNEIDLRSAGQSVPQRQSAQTDDLRGALTEQRHPHLAAALPASAQIDAGDSAGALFERVLTGVLGGLLGEGTRA